MAEPLVDLADNVAGSANNDEDLNSSTTHGASVFHQAALPSHTHDTTLGDTKDKHEESARQYL